MSSVYQCRGFDLSAVRFWVPITRSTDVPITRFNMLLPRPKFAAPQTVIVSDRCKTGVERSKSGEAHLVYPSPYSSTMNRKGLYNSTPEITYSSNYQFWQFRRFWQSLAALCLRPSARPPPPIALLLITKAKPQFERTVDSLSKLFFLV